MDAKMKFALAVLNRTLQHFDGGGTVLSGPGAGTNNTASNPDTGIMGTFTGALGLNNEFKAGAADILPGTNVNQLNDAYSGVQNALQQQQMLANALQPGSYQAALSQQMLLKQLEGQAQGYGPNPAQTQLAQNTGANTANQAALMAGQRGASGNVGMMARQAAQQGATNQQNMAGQAATLQAQQQLSAQQQLAQQQGALVNQGLSGTNSYNQSQQNEQNILQNANTAANNANVQMQSNMNNVNSQTAAANQSMKSGIFGGIMNGGAAASMLAKGGEVPEPTKCMHCGGGIQHMAAGGAMDPMPMNNSMMPQQPMMMQPQQPMSYAGQWLNSSPAPSMPNIEQTQALPPIDLGGFGDKSKSSGSESSGEQGGGGMMKLAMLALKGGGKIPGEPKVKGDSYENDTYPAMLSPGEVVIPNHIMQSKDPAKNAGKFVAAILAKKNGLRKSA